WKGFSQTCPVRVSRIRAQMNADFGLGNTWARNFC
ncbi:MAG: hypothetical protein AVDCRST_MAG56-4876, partial [uncultured Cytophagales bacterium]